METYTLRAPINLSASGDNTVIAADTGKRIILHKVQIWSNGSVTLKLLEGDTAFNGAGFLMAAGSHFFDIGEPLALAPSKAFVINLSANVVVTGFVLYVVEV
jgi:hypothetical protein